VTSDAAGHGLHAVRRQGSNIRASDVSPLR
jgi:hypothetical protein